MFTLLILLAVQPHVLSLSDSLETGNQSRNTYPRPLTWTSYHRESEMVEYLNYLEELYPSWVKVLTIGRSRERRPLHVVKLSTSGNSSKRAIWIDAGFHGGEWIGSAVVLYILSELVERDRNRELVDQVDWYLMPLANPDGYEYSHVGSDRFRRYWRKNRSTRIKGVLGRLLWRGSDGDEWCIGVDLNRNFDFHWGKDRSSDHPCSAVYAGPYPFSEPETKSIAEFILKQERLEAYISFHSFSQLWLLPWAYSEMPAEDHEELLLLARKAVQALYKVRGTVYRVGRASHIMYSASGSSMDWAKGCAGIKYSYAVELRDRGTYGFSLPASQIIPTGREIFAAIKIIAEFIAKQES